MRSVSVHVLDRCCLRCWGLACLFPGVLFLFLAFESFFASVTVAATTSQWVYETTWHVAPRLPEAWQQWLREPRSWPTVHAAVTRGMELPLVLTTGVPGGLAALVGLSFWEEARRQALEERQ